MYLRFFGNYCIFSKAEHALNLTDLYKSRIFITCLASEKQYIYILQYIAASCCTKYETCRGRRVFKLIMARHDFSRSRNLIVSTRGGGEVFEEQLVSDGHFGGDSQKFSEEQNQQKKKNRKNILQNSKHLQKPGKCTLSSFFF